MKITQILYRQHIGFMFKKHWKAQGKRVPVDTGVEDVLKAKGISVEDAMEFVKEEPEVRERINIVGPFEVPRPLNEDHPDYKARPCLTLRHTTVLLEGLDQAQNITKTVVAENQLPPKIEELAELTAPKAIHECVKKAILSANIFDTEQEKLPKIKDPARPAFNFPRILGITDRRKNQILTNKLLHLVERSNDIESSHSKYVVNEVVCNSIFEKDNDLIQFQDVCNILVTSNKPLKHNISTNEVTFKQIPEMYPVKHTITLTPEHFYADTSIYPLKSTMSLKHPHTTWLHYNDTEVSNLYEEPVTPNQVLGRSLTHSFAVATAYAKQLYGENVKDLPEPIHINCIQTNGQKFNFSVFQLNTLNLDGKDGLKNVWYCKNDMKMYDSSRYLNGIPVLENYSPKVYSYINAFYNC